MSTVLSLPGLWVRLFSVDTLDYWLHYVDCFDDKSVSIFNWRLQEYGHRRMAESNYWIFKLLNQPKEKKQGDRKIRHSCREAIKTDWKLYLWWVLPIISWNSDRICSLLESPVIAIVIIWRTFLFPLRTIGSLPDTATTSWYLQKSPLSVPNAIKPGPEFLF